MIFMSLLRSLIGFLGRLCLSLIFIVAGVRMLLDWQGTEHFFIATLCDWLSITMGRPGLQDLVEMAMNHSMLCLWASVFCTIGGGVLVLLGLSVRLGAFLLLLFTLPATILFHHFWSLHGVERQAQMEMFIRNISIIGGLLLLLAYGKGGCKKAKVKEKKSEGD
jgi:putative oxidoreductase